MNNKYAALNDNVTTDATFGSLSALDHWQGPHHHWHIRCLSGVWSGSTAHSTEHLFNCRTHPTQLTLTV